MTCWWTETSAAAESGHLTKRGTGWALPGKRGWTSLKRLMLHWRAQFVTPAYVARRHWCTRGSTWPTTGSSRTTTCLRCAQAHQALCSDPGLHTWHADGQA